MGRPSFQPTPDQTEMVERMAAHGCNQTAIAKAVGIDDKTLRKHFRTILDKAPEEKNANVAKALYESAIGGNVTAQIWWTKARMGWSETQKMDVAASVTVEIVRFGKAP